MSDEMARLVAHVGNKVVDEDEATAAPVRMMMATFNRPEILALRGTAIPEGWHGLYFLPNTAPDELSRDGAPLSSGVIPEMPFPRRMFAGSRQRFHKPIRIGDKLTRETELIALQPKDGSTGKMAIATVINRIIGPNGLCVEEERDTMFREETKPGAKNAAPRQAEAPADTVWEDTVTPDETVLFRFSSLTFNTHRIHYDAHYAEEVEGYPALVVHGPLSQTYLQHFARDNNPGKRFVAFEMRARAPLFVNQTIKLVGRPEADGSRCAVWALTPQGGIAMSAIASFA